MKRYTQNKVVMVVMMMLFGLGVACTPAGSAGSDELTMYVGSETADCVGLVPQQCLLVKFDPNAEWEFHYDGIEGFAYEPGFEYQLRVRRVELADPPADGSSIIYQLIEVQEKTAVVPPPPLQDTVLVGTSWTLNRTEQNGGTFLPQPNSNVTLDFLENGEIGGNASCNNYFGSYTIGANGSLQLGNIGITEMACVEDGLMQQETDFVDALSNVERFTLDGGTLVLVFANGTLHFDPVLPEPPQSLTGTVWQLTTFETADVVYTPFADTELTAEFNGQQVAGSAGCNRYFGDYTLNGEQMSLGALGSTMMACKGETMTQEMEFLDAMSNVMSYHIEGNQLTLAHTGGALIFVMADDTSVAPPQPETIPWEAALDILNSGEVVEVFQTHSLDVTLVLADGSSVHTIEPGIDDIFTAVSDCGEPCANIMIATE